MSSLDVDEAVQPPPAPPPLPRPRYATRAANALARFAQPFFQGSRLPIPDGETSRLPRTPRPRPLTARSNTSSSSSVVHRTGIPIAAVDVSPDRSHAILAGREILKTVRVTPDSCNEALNLRSAITSYSSTQSSSQERGVVGRKSQLIANDVKWAHSNYSSVIATAAPNGQIILYDLDKASVQVACLHEHTRQVHRLAFNPHHAALLLSASQDGTTRLWDLRTGHRNGAVGRFESKAVFVSSSESVRDVRWSPTRGMEFVACTDSGMIQQWDILQSGKPVVRFKAHAKTCRAIDWHPDGKHVVSGGADKTINIWDLSTHNSRMKPYLQIRAPQPVSNVRWRPPYLSRTQNTECWQATQLAATYDAQEPKIHIWDVRRPHIPFRHIAHYDTAATDLLWHSEDLLWSVGNAGMFTQTDVKQIKFPLQVMSHNGVAVSPDGQLCFFSEGRRPNRSSSVDSYDDYSPHIAPMTGEKTGNSSESPSAYEGSFKDSTTSLPVRFRQRKAPKSLSFRSTNPSFSMSGTTQSLLRFDESVPRNVPSRLLQATARGRIADIARPELFRFFAEKYQLVGGIASADHGVNSYDSIFETLQRNVELAHIVGEDQLSQTWRILAWAARKEFASVAPKPPNQVPKQDYPRKSIEKRDFISPNTLREADVGRAEASQRKAVARLKSNYGSNAATPIVRPVSDLAAQLSQSRAGTYEKDIVQLALPAPRSKLSESLLHQKTSPQPLGILRHQTAQSSFEENAPISTSHSSGSELATGVMDFEKHEGERRREPNGHQLQPRSVLRLDQRSNDSGLINTVPSFIRHNSEENDMMFSAGTDSSLCTTSLGSSFNSSVLAGSPLKNVLHAAASSEELYNEASVLHVVYPIKIEGSKQQLPSMITDSPDCKKSQAGLLMRPQRRQPPIVHRSEMENLKDSCLVLEEESPAAIANPFPQQPTTKNFTADSPPWSATAMLRPLLEYHTLQLSDCQLPTHIITSLAPLLSHDLPRAFLEAILLTYQDQLTSMSLFVEAAHLRNVVRDSFPKVSDYGIFGVKAGGPWCTFCKKPSKGEKTGFCQRCDSRWDECAICKGGEAFPYQASNEPGSAELDGGRRQGSLLWAWCQECGHSQHSSCLGQWWTDPEMSQGLCPVTGCLHACVPGKARDDVLRAEAEERKAGSYVRGDGWTIGESRAVQKARRMVGDGHRSGSRAGR